MIVHWSHQIAYQGQRMDVRICDPRDPGDPNGPFHPPCGIAIPNSHLDMYNTQTQPMCEASQFALP